MGLFNEFFKKKDEAIVDKQVDNNIEKKSIKRSSVRAFGGKYAVSNNIDIEYFIEHGYLNNPHVYSVISYISKLASDIDLVVEKKDKLGNVVELDESDDLYNLFTNPNKSDSIKEFLNKVYTTYLLTGSCYQMKVSDLGFVIPKELVLLPTEYVNPIKSSNNIEDPIEYYNFSYNSTIDNIETDKIISTLNYNPDACNLKGLPFLNSSKLAISTSNQLQHSESSMIENNGISGIISSGSDSYPITDDELDEMDDNLKRRIGGSGNYNKIITSKSNVQFIELGKTISEMGMEDLDIHLLRKICNVFGISSQVFNDPTNKTYNNLAEAKKSVYTDVIIPLVSMLIDSYNVDLCEPINKAKKTNYKITYNTNKIEVLQKDKKAEADKNKVITDTILPILEKVNNGTITKENAISILIYTLNMTEIEAKNFIK